MSQHERVLLVDSLGNPIITTPFQFDDTDKLAVSAYGKQTVAGDVPLQVNPNGSLGIYLENYGTVGDNISMTGAMFRDQNGSSSRFPVIIPMNYNGANWDKIRNNVESTLLASAARTAQTDSADQVNYNHQGMILFVDVTVDAAAGAITPNIAVKDPVSGTAKVIWTAAAAIAATGQFVYMLLPGAADAGSYTEQKELAVPRDWFFRMTVADADSLTYSVSCCML